MIQEKMYKEEGKRKQEVEQKENKLRAFYTKKKKEKRNVLPTVTKKACHPNK